jgi:hypothetical protein
MILNWLANRRKQICPFVCPRINALLDSIINLWQFLFRRIKRLWLWITSSPKRLLGSLAGALGTGLLSWLLGTHGLPLTALTDLLKPVPSAATVSTNVVTVYTTNTVMSYITNVTVEAHTVTVTNVVQLFQPVVTTNILVIQSAPVANENRPSIVPPTVGLYFDEHGHAIPGHVIQH